MSFVEVPDGVKMPETTTYKRWEKRQLQFGKEHFMVHNSPEAKFNIAQGRYSQEVKRITRVNKFRAKRGLKPLAMPKKPSRASFGLSKSSGGGKHASSGHSGG